MLEPLSGRGLRAEFERCWPWLWKSQCEHGATHSRADVWYLLTRDPSSPEKAFLWPAKRCVILGQFFYWPIGMHDFNYWLQGGSLAELKTLHDGVEQWAERRGAHRITGRGRDGWSRAMNGDWRKGPTTRVKWLVDPAMWGAQ